MRVHFLPSEQQKRNDKAIEKLRRIGYVLFALLMVTLALGAELYMLHPVARIGPQLSSGDGQSNYADAIVLNPNFVLSPTKVTGAAQFIAPGEHETAVRIGSTILPDGTEITLLKLETPTSLPPVSVVVIEPGDALAASASGQEWRGSARAKVTGGYSVDPEINLAAGTAVYRDGDRMSLAGFAFRTTSGSAVVAAQDVISHFPQLNEGR